MYTHAKRLEKKTIVYLLTAPCSLFGFDPGYARLLDRPDQDTALIRKVMAKNRVGYHNPSSVRLLKRNPVLNMNCFHTAQKVVRRAGRDRPINYALLDAIKNPRGLGARVYGEINITNVGPHHPQDFIFYHELGDRLGCRIEVDEEIKAYVEAYERAMLPRIEQMRADSSTKTAAESEYEKLAAFRNSTNPEFIANPKRPCVFPLLEGDRKVIEILSSVSHNNLWEYIRDSGFL
jgi:hypothetical protein